MLTQVTTSDPSKTTQKTSGHQLSTCLWGQCDDSPWFIFVSSSRRPSSLHNFTLHHVIIALISILTRPVQTPAGAFYCPIMHLHLHHMVFCWCSCCFTKCVSTFFVKTMNPPNFYFFCLKNSCCIKTVINNTTLLMVYWNTHCAVGKCFSLRFWQNIVQLL